MTAVIYTLELLQPLLATGPEGDPNSKRSLDYIPGSMMRGFLVGRYLRNLGQAALSIDDSDDRRLFLDGSTRYLNAYPQTLNGNRSLPIPLSWLRPKASDPDREPTAYDYAIDPDPAAIQRRANKQMKSVGGAFCWLEEDRAVVLETKRRISIHTARDRAMGRATAAQGAVFQYDALAAGQSFTGVILAATAQDAEWMVAALRGTTIWLGGSRSAGYGAVRVSTVEIPPMPWQETASVPADLPQGGRLVVTLLSPCIVRSSTGDQSADLDIDSIARCLKVSSADLTVDLRRTRRGLTLIGGFNRTWGLPLCQTQAIAAGSVFVYTVGAAVTAEALKTLADTGLGERIDEGFGRLAVNWQSYAVIDMRKDEPADELPDEEPPPSIATQHQAFATTVAKRLLRRELDQALALRIQDLHLSETTLQRDLIRNSQLSRLRVAARDALVGGTVGQFGDTPLQDSLQRLLRLFNEIKPTGADQFSQARLQDNRRLGDWLSHRLTHPELFWQEEIARPDAMQLGALQIEAPDDWSHEYTVRLIDGVLAQAAKDKKMRRKP